MRIAPSILSADFSRLGEQTRAALDAGAEWIHVDVMDGHFVPNISIGPLVVRALRPIADEYRAVLDVHLMISSPDRYLDEFAKAGADRLSVHVEACHHLHRTIQHIHSLGLAAGVALNPATSLMTLDDVLAEIEMVVVMTVNPGFGGQEFIPSGMDKIARLRQLLAERGRNEVLIQVDGGIKTANVAAAARAGANVAVAGSSVYNSRGSVAENFQALMEALGE